MRRDKTAGIDDGVPIAIRRGSIAEVDRLVDEACGCRRRGIIVS